MLGLAREIEWREEIGAAKYAVIDNFLSPTAFAGVIDAFPVSLENWQRAEMEGADGRQLSHRKWVRSDLGGFPTPLQAVIAMLHGADFVSRLEAASGIPDLLIDAKLHGGGLHQYLPGAVLSVHADANVQPETGWRRRLNLILYLNRCWGDAWGGAFELWSDDGARLVQSIAPKGNRAILFANTPGAYHAISRVSCPEGESRKSLMVRYYTHEPPNDDASPPRLVHWAQG